MEFLVAFASAFAVIALAELGDKTQILAITLSSKYRRIPVLLGLMSALMFLTLIAVLGGTAIYTFVSPFYVRALAIIVFLAFGIYTITDFLKNRGTEEAETINDRKMKTAPRIFAYAFLMILMAEFGDKTQLMAIVLTSAYSQPVAVFFGASLAFLAVDGPCVVAGSYLGKKIKLSYIKLVSGIIFIAIGIYYLIEMLG